MVLSKRERVIRTLEHEEPDCVPIHNMGFEHTSKIFQVFLQSEERRRYETQVKGNHFRKRYYLTEQRFWNVDISETVDPFGFHKMKNRLQSAPPDGYNFHRN